MNNIIKKAKQTKKEIKITKMKDNEVSGTFQIIHEKEINDRQKKRLVEYVEYKKNIEIKGIETYKTQKRYITTLSY